jgi:ubiquinone/menaquinone biosynthesis C-methylase UbiE
VTPELPFAAAEMLGAAGRPGSVLDMGCGSGRLTVELARREAAATGIDTSDARLAEARSRSAEAAVDVEWLRADFNQPLPFADGRFDAAVSRLSLMVARDPVATLREAARVLRPGGVVVTALWAAIEQNPWFGVPRSAIADTLGPEGARFAAAFGRLGTLEELEQTHRAAGFGEVRGQLVSDWRTAAGAVEHWAALAAGIGHFQRLGASLTTEQSDHLLERVTERLEPYRVEGELRIPRRIVLVSARRPAKRPQGTRSEWW